LSDDLEIYVRSNTDGLSARVLHDCLYNLVETELIGGETFLKALVPKKTGSLEQHVGHSGPFDEGIEISGSVGIPMIEKTSESGSYDPNSSLYPLFVDKGTGIFGDKESPIFARKGEFMKLPPDGINSMFQREVKGQRGHEFMAATYGLMKAMLEINGAKFKEELRVKLKADQLV
jgi:hypothetical protein